MRIDVIHVLLIEDDPEDALLARKLLTRRTDYRFDVRCADSLQAGIALLDEATDAVLLDLSLPDAQGWETFARLLAAAPHVPIVLLTGHDDEQLSMKAIQEGAQDYLLKNDLNASVLQRGIRHAIERKRTEEQLQELAEELRAKNDQVAEELELAREMQQALLPQRYPVFPAGVEPGRSALRFAHTYRASQFLGGDFVNIRAVSDTAACVFICDVMGHGVRSALVTATVRGLLEETGAMAHTPGLLLTELSRALREVTKRPGQLVFASAACLLIDVGRRRLSYAIAGHPCPLYLAADGACRPIDPGLPSVEPALGLFPDQAFTTFHRPLSAGDRFLTFTDGLFEVEDAAGAPYGKDRVLASARSHAGLELDGLVQALVDDATAFAGGRGLEDDVCVVGIRVERLAPATQQDTAGASR